MDEDFWSWCCTGADSDIEKWIEDEGFLSDVCVISSKLTCSQPILNKVIRITNTANLKFVILWNM